MKRLLAIFICGILAFASCAAARSSDKLAGINSFICFYGDSWPGGTAPRADLFILDAHHPPGIAVLKSQKTHVVGYLTVGEINNTSPDFARFKKSGVLVDENKNWPGSWRVDLRKKEWRSYIVDALVPRVIAQGFDGIFIDTIDTAEYLRDIAKIPNAVEGAVELIKDIRKHHPKIVIVLNNGLSLLDQVGNVIDALLVEDIFTSYNFETKQYGLASPEHKAARMTPAKQFHEKFHKPVLALDYLKETDTEGIKRVANEARAQGFVPYISDIDLDTIFFHN
jgi:uncharacterized protein (TIGR01370 family)